MAWFALARVVFVAAVAYAAAVLQPLPLNLAANVAFALVLAASVVFFESRLAETPVTRLLRPRPGRQAGQVARAVAPDRPLPRRRSAAALQDPRHQRDHRRPHRRRLR